MVKLFNSNRSDKFNFSNKSFDEIQNFLANYKLFSFSHRVFIRLDLFLFKIVNFNYPPYLSEKLKTNSDDNIANNLRSNYMQQDTQSKDHSKEIIRESDHFETIYIETGRIMCLMKKHLIILLPYFLIVLWHQTKLINFLNLNSIYIKI